MFTILSFVAGVTTLCFTQSLFFANHSRYLLLLSVALVVVRITIKHKVILIENRHLKMSFAALIDAIVAFIIAAVYAQTIAQTQLDSRLPHQFDGVDVRITGTVLGLVEQRKLDNNYRKQNFYQRFLFKVDDFDNIDEARHNNKDKKALKDLNTNNSQYQPRIIQINNYDYLPIKSGQQWQLTLRLKKPRSNSNPGSFDYLRYLLSQRIDATAYIRPNTDSQLINQGRAQWASHIRAARAEALTTPLSRLKNAGLLKALLLGDRSDLTGHDRILLQRTGTSHLLAISGLHISVAALFAALLAKGFLWLLPKLMHYSARVIIIAIACLPIATFYAVVAGFSLSTQRALIMLSCFLFIVILRRQTHLLQTLCLSALIMVVIDPLAVLSAGFWFSFSAVAILLWASRAMHFHKTHGDSHTLQLPLWGRIISSLKEKFALFLFAQLAIFIAMPLVLSMFTGQSSLITPLANLLAIPIISFAVVPAGIAGLLCSYLSPTIAEFFLVLADFFLGWILLLLQLLEDVASYLRHKPINIHLVSYQPPFSPVIFCLVFVSIIILLSRRSLPAYGAAIIVWLVVFNPFGLFVKSSQSALKPGDLLITQLDVGQGTALLLSLGKGIGAGDLKTVTEPKSSQYHLLYDTGPKFSSSSHAANRIIEPYLALMGINKIDTAIVSHGDSDHSGGAQYLFEYGNIKAWLLGGSARIQGHAAPKKCHAGQSWQVNGFDFEILHPAAVWSKSDSGLNNRKKLANENDQSCVLSVRQTNAERALVLLTGDISQTVERQLVDAERAKLAADVLLVPHHGSGSSSSPSLLAAVQPLTALISAGYRNRYHHPHPDVLERYRNRGISTYRSDQLGAIQMLYRNGKWLGPYCAKYLAKHFWQDVDQPAQCIGAIHRTNT